MFNGGQESVRLESIPPGADVSYTNGQYVGQTPADATLSRASLNNSVVFKKDGYEDAHVSVEHRPEAGWFVWDIATCVIPVTLCVPLVVDAFSGGWFGIDERYTVKLTPAKAEPGHVALKP
jgi:hypothetical protein